MSQKKLVVVQFFLIFNPKIGEDEPILTTLQETNMEPENEPRQEEIPMKNHQMGWFNHLPTRKKRYKSFRLALRMGKSFHRAETPKDAWSL